MPYISQGRRDLLASGKIPPITAGDLNYVITNLCIDFVGRDLTYNDVALVTGVLENAKQEFYRRLAAPYEDSKIQANGDVY